MLMFSVSLEPQFHVLSSWGFFLQAPDFFFKSLLSSPVYVFFLPDIPISF